MNPFILGMFVALTLWLSPLVALVEAMTVSPLAPAVEAMAVSQIDLTGGAVDHSGRFHRVLDRLLEGSGTIKMGQYQAMGDIVPSITKGGKTYSLFTSGLNGAPAPSATANGASITVDLSSLFLGVRRGDSFRIWNIGEVATGLFDSDRLEFCLTWDHLFGERPKRGLATFALQGNAHIADVAAVPLVTTGVLFATGLAMLLGVWRRREGVMTASV